MKDYREDGTRQAKDTVCINGNSRSILGKKYFHNEGSQTLGQVAQRSYGISVLGDIHT